jgi:hypothetical protein
MIFFETILLRAFLLAFLYLFVIHNLFILRENATKKRAVISGLWIGLAWVCKPNFMVIAPLLLLWIFWVFGKTMSRKESFFRLAFVVLGLGSVLALPIGRNMILRHRFEAKNRNEKHWTGKNAVPLFSMTTRGPYSYVNGNSYHSADNPGDLYPGFQGDFINPGMTWGIGWDFNTLKTNWYGAKFYSRDSAFARQVLSSGPTDEDWKENLGSLSSVMRMVWAEHSLMDSWWERFFPMLGYKIYGFFNGYETPNNTNINVHRKFSPAMKFFPLGSTLICTLFLLAMIVLWRKMKEAEYLLLFAFILVYMAITVAFYFISRFRVPILPLMYIVGATGVFHLGSRWHAMISGKRFAIVLGGFVCLLIAWPRDVRGAFYQEAYEILRGIRYADYYNYALGRQVLRKPEEAFNITRKGVKQRGALVFSSLSRIHFWALVRLPDRKNELLHFCHRLEDFYMGRDGDPVNDRRGPLSWRSDSAHLALFSLSLQYLILRERQNHEISRKRWEIFNQLIEQYGQEKLFRCRYVVVGDQNLARIPQAMIGSFR